MTSDVVFEVDQLLLEHGEYLPLELLLRGGRLMYPDYEAWRHGEIALLDQALFGDPEQVLELLAEAAAYLERRGWRAETLTYRRWGADAAVEPLRFSLKPALDDRFHRRYRRPEDQPQLDLFTDAPDIVLQNGILQALENRDAGAAREGLDRLLEVAPDHPRLGALERLTEALEDLDRPVQDVAAELDRLETQLIPLADELLGGASRHLLIPLWRRLSAALEGQRFDPAHPTLHVSYTAARALDWEAALAAVEREPHWQRDCLLLERFATAAERRNEPALALPAWFRLCWHFPDAAAAIAASADRVLTSQWSAFQDLDVPLPTAAFPAWLLLQRPALGRVLPEPTDGPDSFRTVYHLQRRRAVHPPDAEILALRAQLKQQDALLFATYMSALDTG